MLNSVSSASLADELPNKSDEGGDENCDDDEEEEEEKNNTDHSGPRPQGPIHRRPFHPNFHPGDHRRFPHHQFDSRGPQFERGPSLDRCSHQKFFGRPFHSDQQHPSFHGARRRPFKFLGRGGFYVRGPSPYAREGGPRRRWSEDEGLVLEDGREEELEDGEEAERPSQPVHTVLIDNEEYTKIQTPRQEVIFKKSSLDRKRDSIDMGSVPSTCGSVTGGDHGSQGDQASVAGSVEDTVISSEEPQQNNPDSSYEDANNLFLGEPGKPPPMGFLMQPAYPGGPMISVPVHWTPFLDPGLIRGYTGFAPLDPAFSRVVDPKDLPVDPTHIHPAQHVSNGVPVTVQVKVNADGLPIEIEPSVLTLSLNTLELHQQDMLLQRNNTDVIPNTPQVPEYFSEAPQSSDAKNETSRTQVGEDKDSGLPIPQSDVCEEGQSQEKSGVEHKDSEDSSSDSQYASMSEASTTPTTPPGELSDPSDCPLSSKSKVRNLCGNPAAVAQPQTQRLVDRADSLLDSESMETEENEDSCALHHAHFPIAQVSGEEGHVSDNSRVNSTPASAESEFDDARTSKRNLSVPSSSDEACIATDFVASESPVQLENCKVSEVSETQDIGTSKKNDSRKKNKKSRKSRSLSLESNRSSQNSSLGDVKVLEKVEAETISKYQAKRTARKAKKEKKRSNKENSKIKNNNKKIPKTEGSQEDRDSIEAEETSCQDSEFLNDEVEGKDESEQIGCTENSVSDKPTQNTCSRMDHPENFEVEESTADEGNTQEGELSSDEKMEYSTTESSVQEREGVLEATEQADKEETSQGNVDSSEEKKNGEQCEGDIKEAQTSEAERSTPDKDEKDSETTSDPKEDNENYVCKPGYLMVPILTPYYDPAALYGYPIVVPENPPERTYNRKKKKKFKKKYQEELYLDSELYTGEPFVATPNGYIVPVEPQQICHVHGFQYAPNMYHQILPDEGFVSVEHSPYIQEYVPEPMYHRMSSYEEIERFNRGGFSPLHNAEKKQIKEVLQEQTNVVKDSQESCDSGVSESEETNLLANRSEKRQEDKAELQESKKENEGKKETESKQENGDKDEKGNSKKDNKKRNKNKRKEKSKKQVIEILEPDFSSFSSSVLRFESKDEKEVKQKRNKNSKLKKKQNSKEQKHSECQTKTDSPLPQTIDELSNRVSSQESILNEVKSQFTDNTSPRKSKKNKQPVESQPLSSIETSQEVINDQTTPTNLPSKKLKGAKKKSKNSKPGKLKLMDTDEGKEENLENSLTNTNECPTSDCCVVPLQDDSSSQLSENIALSDSCLSQESEVTTLNEPEFVQELEHKSDTLEILSQECEEHVAFEDDIKDDSHSSLNDPENKIDLSHQFSEDLAPVLQEDKLSELASVQTLNSSVPAFSEENPSPCNDSSFNEVPVQSCPQEESTSTSPVPKEQFPLLQDNVDDDDDLGQVYKDLGVTEAVRRWIREVTPEKAFSLSDETRTRLLSSVITSCDEDESDTLSDDDVSITEEEKFVSEHQPKNVQGNPSVASPNEYSLDARSERVAPLMIFQPSTHQHGASIPGELRPQVDASQDAIDEYDGESVISNLSRGRLYSSSSCSSFPIISNSEETSLLTDPRVYDPNIYSKYYQLGVDVQPTPSNTSTRESTLSPTIVESGSEEMDLFSDHKSPTPVDIYTMPLATELFKSEKLTTTMTHISPSLQEEILPMPYCGCPGRSLGDNPQLLWDAAKSSIKTPPERFEVGQLHEPCCSVSSSGIGSSLASTPNVSPAHSSSSSCGDTNIKPRLEPHPLKNLSVGESSLPCKAVCCSVM